MADGGGDNHPASGDHIFDDDCPPGHTAYSYRAGSSEARIPAGHTAFSYGQPSAADRAIAAKMNKFGAACFDSGKRELLPKAEAMYRGALRRWPGFAFARFNLATLLCCPRTQTQTDRAARLREALAHLRVAVAARPSFKEAHANAAALLLKLCPAADGDGDGNAARLEEARLACLAALRVDPGYADAHWNLASVLRRLGRKEAAVARTWRCLLAAAAAEGKDTAAARRCAREAGVQVGGSDSAASESDSGADGEEAGGDETPRPPNGLTDERPLAVVCVKWGAKYNAGYVNKLARAVRRHLSAPHEFFCFTDNADGVGVKVGADPEEYVRVRPLPDNGWGTWWTKPAALFGPGLAAALGGGPAGRRVLYIDLDTVIVGSLDDLAAYRGPFALLSTTGLANEGFDGGYNSSVMAFGAGWGRARVWRPLAALGLPLVRRFVHRFDHWLEMCAPRADVLQDLLPGQLVEYARDCRGRKDGPPAGARVVNFPLEPKPHAPECRALGWVVKHWGHFEQPR